MRWHALCRADDDPLEAEKQSAETHPPQTPAGFVSYYHHFQCNSIPPSKTVTGNIALKI